MLFIMYKLGILTVFSLRSFGSYNTNEIYNFDENNDLQLAKNYIKENKKIMSVEIQDYDNFFYLNDIYQIYTIVDDINSENIKRNNNHSYTMLIFPMSNFPGNNYSKLNIYTESSNTEIDLTKNNEWIGILIPVNIHYEIILKNDAENTQVLKVIFNRNDRFSRYGVKEIKFDMDDFRNSENFSDDYLNEKDNADY